MGTDITAQEHQDGATMAVIIVNFNGGDLTKTCLDSLAKSSLPASHILVIDNASNDGSAEVISDLKIENLELIQNDENLGFAKACNQGIKRALELGVDYAFLLNNDARLDVETLAHLVRAAEENPKAGLLGGKIFWGDGPNLWCAGMNVGFYPNLQQLRGFGKPDQAQFEAEEEVDALTGCGLLLRRDFMLKDGLFDEDFFVYVEDLELSLRAREAGWSCLYVPSALLYHDAGSTSGRGYSAWRKYMLAYNLVLFLKKRGSFSLWLAFLVFDVLCWPLVLLASILRGRTRGALAKGQGLLAGILGLKANPPRSSSE